MRRSSLFALLLFSASLSPVGGAQTSMTIPADFPEFRVPGYESDMQALRELYWLHYPTSSPKATLWDEWLVSPSLWPAVADSGPGRTMRESWRQALSARILDPEGYVATHQHASIAHQLGWPFPAWQQGGGFGWHFSFKHVPGPPWRPSDLNTTAGWQLAGAEDAGLDPADGWNLRLNAPNALATAPPLKVQPNDAPFLQLRWRTRGLSPDARPYVEWTTSAAPSFSPERRMYFDPPPADTADAVYTMIPLSRHPGWTGEITRLRLGFGNARPGVEVLVRGLFAQYDTRHNVNNLVWPVGCATYFHWTRDLNFLRANLQRMRTSLRYAMDEFRTLQEKVVLTPWPGHDGRSGVRRREDGRREVRSGEGIGTNYWDLLPFSHKDTYATIRLYHALNVMAGLEREIAAHPEWNMPAGFLRLNPEELTRHAAEVKEAGNRLFWNEETGRFVAAVDVDGQKPDFGLTFLNLEAVHYGFATPEHADSILQWIGGERVVAGDTAQTTDIYAWRFGPRATTKRNVDYYMWVWSGAGTIPWGGQVQDGGAVLGFSYHDLMARLRVRGPDNAWARLQQVAAWFREVQQAGGYRAYYDGRRKGTLQGGGTAGGLGLDEEFFESVLVPQVVLDGFLGFSPAADGFALDPRLPSAWPELSVSRIRFQDRILDVRAAPGRVEVTLQEGAGGEPDYIRLGGEGWTGELVSADSGAAAAPLRRRQPDGAFEVQWPGPATARFTRPEGAGSAGGN